MILHELCIYYSTTRKKENWRGRLEEEKWRSIKGLLVPNSCCLYQNQLLLTNPVFCIHITCSSSSSSSSISIFCQLLSHSHYTHTPLFNYSLEWVSACVIRDLSFPVCGLIPSSTKFWLNITFKVVHSSMSLHLWG